MLITESRVDLAVRLTVLDAGALGAAGLAAGAALALGALRRVVVVVLVALVAILPPEKFVVKVIFRSALRSA